MSMVKRLMEEQEHRRSVAIHIALEAGVLKRCPFHDTIYDGLNGDNTPAYKLGNYQLSSGQLTDVFSNSREMTDEIKAAIEDAGMECYRCEQDKDA